MTAEQLYYTLSLLVNKNNENAEIYIEKENFVLLYNREMPRWLSDYIEKNNSTDLLDNLEELVIREHHLLEVESTSDKTVYKLPEDYFSVIMGDFRSKTNCGVIYNWLSKNNDINTALEDKTTRPSAAWERGLASIGGKHIVVYKSGFEITDTTISYYRKPREIDLLGYVTLDNKQSQNIDPDIDDYLCNQILDRVATEIKREWPNSSEFQLAQTRERGY
jgi:hypothetical protein